MPLILENQTCSCHIRVCGSGKKLEVPDLEAHGKTLGRSRTRVRKLQPTSEI